MTKKSPKTAFFLFFGFRNQPQPFQAAVDPHPGCDQGDFQFVFIKQEQMKRQKYLLNVPRLTDY